MIAKSGQTRQNLFLFHIHVQFCSFPELTTSLTDLAIIGKKRNSIKLTPYQTGFFPLTETIFFSFFFLEVPQTLCPVYVSQIDGFCDLLGGNLAHYTDSVNAIQLTALKLKICQGLRHSFRYRIIWILSCKFSSEDADLL